MTLAPRTIRGPFGLFSRIGAGGIGELHRNRDARLIRELPVEVLSKAFTDSQIHMRCFGQEVRTLAAISHPGVLVIQDADWHQGAPGLSLKLLNEEVSRRNLESAGLPLGKATDHALQNTRGLTAAQDKGSA
jgi:hypothetical protein